MLFPTHHHQFQRARAVSLPDCAVRGKTHGLGRTGVVGAFIPGHAGSVFFLPASVTPKHP